MPIYGLDTSVILRLLTGEPQDQALAAKTFVEQAAARGDRLVVSDLAVAEVYFALHTHFKVPKTDAPRVILRLFEDRLIEPEDGGVALIALNAVITSSRRLGFVDHMIHARYSTFTATMVSFERAAKRLNNAIVLE
ncbi:MAG TPA: PIN domain-containing protein [Planctomycetota bacterium]|nr:PIN domain-containing protein [Planctomycetota bacterium]